MLSVEEGVQSHSCKIWVHEILFVSARKEWVRKVEYELERGGKKIRGKSRDVIAKLVFENGWVDFDGHESYMIHVISGPYVPFLSHSQNQYWLPLYQSHSLSLSLYGRNPFSPLLRLSLLTPKVYSLSLSLSRIRYDSHNP